MHLVNVPVVNISIRVPYCHAGLALSNHDHDISSTKEMDHRKTKYDSCFLQLKWKIIII